MNKYLVTVMLILSPLSAFASKMDGTWNGNFEASFGSVQFSAVYKVSGEKLSGNITATVGGNLIESEIENGVISGDTIEYSFDGGRGRLLTHKGKLVNDNEILIDSSTGIEIKLTRVE